MFPPLKAAACLAFATSLAACCASARDLPHTYAMVLFPGFAPLDVFGPLGPLQMAAFHHGATLHLVAETLDPVSNQLHDNSTFSQSVVPTSTFDDFLAAGTGVDVLIVPGGPGVRASDEEVAPVVEFVKTLYPGVEHLITVCTGSGIAARAGILDGRRATTNKAAWDEITAMGPNVEWVSPARWVVDGNIWSSSGVMAGLDLTAEWMRGVYGDELVEHSLGMIEHTAHPQDYDPFADMFGVPPSP